MRRFLTALLCTSMLLMGAVACSDDGDDDDASDTTSSTSTTESPEPDGPTTLAQGEDVEIVGSDGIGGQTLNITAQEEDGEVTGEFRITEVVVALECADTDTDGVVILGGKVTTPDSDDPGSLGELLALVIREGDPDSVALTGNDDDAVTCDELLESITAESLTDDTLFTDVEAGSDIVTS